MTDYKDFLLRLNNNLNILREREARHAGNAPVDLLNEITDHKKAIALTEQTLRDEITEAEWYEALRPLLVSLPEEAQKIINATNIGVVGDYAQIGSIVFQTVTTPTGKPLQRPPRAVHFTDRKDELAKLLANLQPGKVVTLCGPGGIGKSALAAEAVWALSEGDEPPVLFPDGVIFHSFYNQPQAALALEAIARAYGEEPKPMPRDAAQRALAGKRALLLLDGTEDADDLRAVLDVRGGCGAIVTSRTRKDAVSERQDMQPLALAEAAILLQKWGREQADDTAAVEKICQLVGRLPLAVRLVGRYLDEMDESAAGYLDWLEDTPLEALDQGQRRKESVPVLLAKSLAQVSDTACGVLGVVGLLALAPFGREVLATALNREENALRQPLGELVSYGLLTRQGEWYEVSHALIHTYAREKVQPEVETVGRLAAYYTQLAEIESEKGPKGYARLDVERMHIMHVLATNARQDAWAACRLVRAMQNYLRMQGYTTELVTALEIGLTAAHQAENRHDEGTFQNNLGLAYSDLGQMDRAIEYYKQALTISHKIGHNQGEGAALGNLGTVYRAMGQMEQAIKYYEQALVIDREIGYRQGEANNLGNLGNAYSDLGDVHKGIEYYEQALVIDREIGHRQGEGNKMTNLGLAYYDLGQMEQAIEYYEQALVIHREIDYRQGEGAALANLGLAYRTLGKVEGDEDHPGAIEYLKQAQVIFEEIKSPAAARVCQWVSELEGNN